jgi:hypothetical protein
MKTNNGNFKDIPNVRTIDSNIEKLYMHAGISVSLFKLTELSSYLNILEISDRVPFVYELFEIDKSLGPCGFAPRFDIESKPKTYGFGQLLKYDHILRPIKYVYMPFGMASCPAAFSRDIAQNACAYVEECFQNLLIERNLKIRPKATLGKLLYDYRDEIHQRTFNLIDLLNKYVYGKSKHEFVVELPNNQLFTLSESLAIYFVCRVIGLTLLKDANTLPDIEFLTKLSQTQPGLVIGQDWYI